MGCVGMKDDVSMKENDNNVSNSDEKPFTYDDEDIDFLSSDDNLPSSQQLPDDTPAVSSQHSGTIILRKLTTDENLLQLDTDQSRESNVDIRNIHHLTFIISHFFRHCGINQSIHILPLDIIRFIIRYYPSYFRFEANECIDVLSDGYIARLNSGRYGIVALNGLLNNSVRYRCLVEFSNVKCVIGIVESEFKSFDDISPLINGSHCLRGNRCSVWNNGYQNTFEKFINFEANSFSNPVNTNDKSSQLFDNTRVDGSNNATTNADNNNTAVNTNQSWVNSNAIRIQITIDMQNQTLRVVNVNNPWKSVTVNDFGADDRILVFGVPIGGSIKILKQDLEFCKTNQSLHQHNSA